MSLKDSEHDSLYLNKCLDFCQTIVKDSENANKYFFFKVKIKDTFELTVNHSVDKKALSENNIKKQLVKNNKVKSM